MWIEKKFVNKLSDILPGPRKEKVKDNKFLVPLRIFNYVRTKGNHLVSVELYA